MFCTKCGSQIADGSKFCTDCGAPSAVGPAVNPAVQTQAAPMPTSSVVQASTSTGPAMHQQPGVEAGTTNTSGMGKDAPLPPGISRWSWGAFLLNGIWAIFNNTWIGLLSFIPFVGLIMCFILGFRGREWAWRNKRWRSIEHFNEVQKRWSFWSVITIVIFPVVAAIISASMLEESSSSSNTAQPGAQQLQVSNAMSISAIDLYAAYASNEIAADQKFKGEALVVTGVVDSIDSDFSDEPRISLRGEPGESFLAYVYADGIDKKSAASLQKGQSITIACTGGGEVMGFPELDDCELH